MRRINDQKNKYLLNIIAVNLFVFLVSSFAFAQEPPPAPPGAEPTMSGTWNYSVLTSDITEAGNDFSGTYESASNQLIFDRNTTFRDRLNWSITINKSDVTWNPAIKLWIRRTGNGNPTSGATISGGNNYQEVVNSELSFFSGYRESNGVPIQLKVTGISVVIPIDTYYTNLVFTITEF